MFCMAIWRFGWPALYQKKMTAFIVSAGLRYNISMMQHQEIDWNPHIVVSRHPLFLSWRCDEIYAIRTMRDIFTRGYDSVKAMKFVNIIKSAVLKPWPNSLNTTATQNWCDWSKHIQTKLSVKRYKAHISSIYWIHPT